MVHFVLKWELPLVLEAGVVELLRACGAFLSVGIVIQDNYVACSDLSQDGG